VAMAAKVQGRAWARMRYTPKLGDGWQRAVLYGTVEKFAKGRTLVDDQWKVRWDDKSSQLLKLSKVEQFIEFFAKEPPTAHPDQLDSDFEKDAGDSPSEASEEEEE
jgi:hypothetical protein